MEIACDLWQHIKLSLNQIRKRREVSDYVNFGVEGLCCDLLVALKPFDYDLCTHRCPLDQHVFMKKVALNCAQDSTAYLLYIHFLVAGRDHTTIKTLQRQIGT